MELPKNESSFEFSHQALTKKYEGLFTVHCILNMRQKHAIEVQKTRLLMDMANPTDELKAQALLLSNLRIRIIDGPEWWKQSDGGLNIIDDDALFALFNKVLDAEDKWKEPVRKLANPPAPAAPEQAPQAPNQ